jgi:PAP2 superfamily
VTASTGHPALLDQPTRTRRKGWHEFLFVAAIYGLYDLTRLVDAGRPATAKVNARRLLRFERRLHLSPESWLNHFVAARALLAIPADYAYASLHYVVTLFVLLWLWRANPDAYVPARRWLTATTLLGLVGFATFPLAPPRELPGFIDTMAHYGQYGWWGTAASAPKGLGGLTNQYAAMPSLHIGWSTWCAWQLAANARWRLVQLLAIAYPVFMVFVVLGTANHYLADVIAGLVVFALGHVVSDAITRVVRGAQKIPVQRRGPAVRTPAEWSHQSALSSGASAHSEE